MSILMQYQSTEEGINTTIKKIRRRYVPETPISANGESIFLTRNPHRFRMLLLVLTDLGCPEIPTYKSISRSEYALIKFIAVLL